MNVRIDWEQSSRRQPPAASSRSEGSNGRRFGKGPRVLGALILGTTAMVVALVVTDSGRDKEGGDAGPLASPTPSVTASADWGGMSMGAASAAGTDCSRRVSGLPWGCPHSKVGAVEAATQVVAATYEMERMTAADRTAWVKTTFGRVPADTESAARLYQSQNNLNASGQLINPSTKRPVTDQRFTSLCHPELGAYRVRSASPDAVKVDVWQVCISGTIGPDTARNLSANWMVGEVALGWTGRDWEVASVDAGGFTQPPTPKDVGQAVTTYAQRARILAEYGPGWTLYADASEKPPAETGGTQ